MSHTQHKQPHRRLRQSRFIVGAIVFYACLFASAFWGPLANLPFASEPVTMVFLLPILAVIARMLSTKPPE